MIQQQLTGTGVALVTPFTNTNEVDTKTLQTLVNSVIENGVEYLVVLGTTSEGPTLSKEEKELVKKTITEANNGRVPMVLGIGGNNTAEVVNQLKATNTKDYVAILSVSPYYNKPTQEGIYQHFKAISEASPLPIMLDNVPGRTGSNMSAKTTIRLANDFKNIIAVKEAAGNIVQMMELLQNKPKDFLVISGDDMLALPSTLMGGDGVISVIGQGLPKDFSEMIRLGLQGKTQEAYQKHYQMMNLFSLIFKEGNPAGVKSLLKIKGIGNGKVRLPLVPATDELTEEIKREL